MLKEAVNIVFCGFLVALSFLALHDLSSLKKSAFDFLSSASVPTFLCWALIFLAAIVMLRSLISILRPLRPTGGLDETEIVAEGDDAATNTNMQLVLVSVISVAYVLTIIFSLLPYAISTTVMLGGCMWILAPLEKRKPALILGLSVCIGTGCAYVFTELLPLPFPGF